MNFIARIALRIFAAILLIGAAHGASAATLFTPDVGPYSAGQTFSVPLYVSTAPGESINAVAGTITFPTERLRVVSVSKAGTMTFWVADPSFSNAAGTISFEGGVYNPGFTGSRGTVLTVTFAATAAGSAIVGIQGASVLANDGLGTEVLSAVVGSTIVIRPAAAAPAGTPTAQPASASAPATSTLPEPAPVVAQVPAPAPATSPAWALPFTQAELLDAAWLFVNYFSVFLLLAGAVGAVVFLVWYAWHRAHRARRHLLKHISSTDTALHGEFIELHGALKDEVRKLREEGEARDLTSNEKAMLKRLSHLVTKTEKAMTEEFLRPRH